MFMREQITIRKVRSKLIIDYFAPPQETKERLEFILSAIVSLVNILKKDYIKENVDKETFNYQTLELIKSELQNEKKILKTLK